jgi:hypothetical protein
LQLSLFGFIECSATALFYKKAKCLNIFGLPECSNRYQGKPVNFVVKAKVAKQVKLGTLDW